MKAYLTKSFQRLAKTEGVSDDECLEAIRRAERGLIDADLGKGLIKQRIPKGNRGAAKGSRAIIFYRRGKLAVFLHIFSKARKGNLTSSELAAYVSAAQELAQLSTDNLTAVVRARGWRELEYDPIEALPQRGASIASRSDD